MRIPASLFACVVGACSHGGGHPQADGGVKNDANASVEVRSVDAGPPRPVVESDVLPASSGEARRSVLASLAHEALLRPQLAMLVGHFGNDSGPFLMQRMGLAGGRTAALVSRRDEGDPIVFAVDRDQLVWSRPRPTAGIAPPLIHLAIAPRPDGGVALFGYVATLHLVASRMWTAEGDPFADIQLFAPGACDALSAAYGPAHGWLVACASSVGMRVQRLRENGTLAWGAEGVVLGVAGATGPATIVFDTPSTSVLLERARAVGGDHLLAARYDDEARPLWTAPLDIGGIPSRPSARSRPASSEERLDAVAVGEGRVRVALPLGLTAKSAHGVEIGPAGDVRLLK